MCVAADSVVNSSESTVTTERNGNKSTKVIVYQCAPQYYITFMKRLHFVTSQRAVTANLSQIRDDIHSQEIVAELAIFLRDNAVHLKKTKTKKKAVHNISDPTCKY